MPKKQKNIIVTYSGDDWHKPQPTLGILTRKSFEYWHTEGLKRGVSIYRASFHWYDQEKHHFTKAWCFRDGTWKKVMGPIIPDMVHDRTAGKNDYALHSAKLAMAAHTKVFNHPNFRVLLDNKLSQYLLLGEFMPKSFVAHSKQELKKNIKNIKGLHVVLKPLYGSGGSGIIIGEREAALRKKITYPVLVQEFIDGSNGIPGLQQKTLADLRIVFINHKPLYALTRVAKKGSFFTNFYKGAQEEMVPLHKIPASARTAVKKICKKLSAFSECQYSLDFIFTKNNKPVLIEMNTNPGTWPIPHIEKKVLLTILSLLP